MGGLYDILESYRLKSPRFTYDGLYQDAPRDDTTYYGGDLRSPYGLGDTSLNDQAFSSSAFPQIILGSRNARSLFDPRVGRPEQSLLYNEPYFINAPQDFSQPIGDPFQTDYPITRDLQEENENVATGIMQPAQDFQFLPAANEADVEDENEVQKTGIAKLFEVLGNIPTPFNLARRGLESLRGFNQRIRDNDFARSQNLMEYLDKRKRRKAIETGKIITDPGSRGSDRDDTPAGFGRSAQGNFTNQFEGGDPGQFL